MIRNWHFSAAPAPAAEVRGEASPRRTGYQLSCPLAW